MNTLEQLAREASALPMLDKWTLASHLWNELEADPNFPPVTKEQLDEMDRRMEEYRNDPGKVTTWEETKARILGSRKRV